MADNIVFVQKLAANKVTIAETNSTVQLIGEDAVNVATVGIQGPPGSSPNNYITNVTFANDQLTFSSLNDAFSGNVDLSSLNPQNIQTINENVRNAHNATILKGTPVAVVAGQTSGNVSDIVPAQANNSSRMPAAFILNEDLDVGEEGYAVISGLVTHIDTSSFSSGDKVYVAPTGGLTTTKPVTPHLIQNLGVIVRSHSNNGGMIVMGAGRSNDVPNLSVGKIFVGSTVNTVESSTIHLDETNNYVGINTNSPTTDLHVVGNMRITGSFYDRTNSPGGSNEILKSTVTGVEWVNLNEIAGVDGSGTANYIAKWSDTDTITNSIIYDNGTNVGIGTSNPTEKLYVAGSARFGQVIVPGSIKHEGDETTEIFFNTGAIDFKASGENRIQILSTGLTKITGPSTAVSKLLEVSGDASGTSEFFTTFKNTSGNAVVETVGASSNRISGYSIRSSAADDSPAAFMLLGSSFPYESPSIEIADLAFHIIATGYGEEPSYVPIHFYTGGGIKASITPPGNFGIGISNPTEKLEVAGDIKADDLKLSGKIIPTSGSFKADLTENETNKAVAYNTTTKELTYYDVPNALQTPTLNVVTNNGNTTANTITVGGLTVGNVTLPSTDGSTGQLLKTDGSGNVTFSDPESGLPDSEYNIKTWFVNDDNFLDVNAPEANPVSVTFKSDGTRIFVLGNTTSTILQYDLSTAWDLTTAGSVTQSSNVRTLSGNLLGGSLQEMYIDSSGTRLYILSSSSDSISQYTIDTAWDISSLTFVQDIHVNTTYLGGFQTGESNPTALTFKSDGTILYVAGYVTDKVFEVPLSTAWDISSHGTFTSLLIKPPVDNVRSIAFNIDGTVFFALDYNGQIIYEFSLSTAWDITTGSYTGNTYPTIGRYETIVDGFYYSETYKKAFVLGRSKDSIYEIIVDDTIKFLDPLSSPVLHTDRLHTPRINMTLESDIQDGLRINRSNNVQYLDIDYSTITIGGSQQGNIRSDYGVNFIQNQNRSNGIIWHFNGNSKTITDTDAEQPYVKISPYVNQSGTANYVGLLMDVTETSVGSGTNSLMDLRVGGSSKFIVRNDGKVGFRTSEPEALFHLKASDGQVMYLESTDGGAFPEIRLRKSSVEYGSIRYVRNGDLQIGNSDDDGGISLRGDNSSDHLVVTHAGKVGIGTTSPAGILHAYSTSAPIIESPSNAALVIRRNDNVAYSSLLKYHSGNSEKFVAGLSDSGDFTDSTGEEYFIGTTKTNPLLVLKNDGKLGIGTTNPSAKLDVAGNIYPTTDNSHTLGQSQTKEWSYVATRMVTGNNNRMVLQLSGDVVVLRDHNGVGDGVQIKNRGSVVAQFGDAVGSGKVGIGTTLPSERLEVNGNIKASGTIKGKMEQMFACNFSDDLGTTKHYIPFTSNAEQSNVHADQAAMVMPYGGRVKSIQMRLSNIDGDATRTFGIETIAPGGNMYASSNNWTIEETEAYEITADDDFYLVNYVFSNETHFDSGDLMAISIQDSEDAYTASRQTYVTVIIEYDLNNGMGNDTATTKYIS